MSENEKFIREIERLLGKIFPEYKRLKDLYPINDIRPAYFGLPGNILHSLLLQLAAVNDTITWPEWWKKNYGRELNENDIEAIDESAKLFKHSYIVFFFARIEFIQRKTINFISPAFDPNSTRPFKQVYDQYLTVLGLNKYIPLYDIVRHIRNSVHTNGFYIPHNGNNVSITWKSKTFQFSHRQAIDGMSIENFIFLFDELIDSIIDIVNTGQMATPTFIEDKFH